MRKNNPISLNNKFNTDSRYKKVNHLPKCWRLLTYKGKINSKTFKINKNNSINMSKQCLYRPKFRS